MVCLKLQHFPFASAQDVIIPLSPSHNQHFSQYLNAAVDCGPRAFLRAEVKGIINAPQSGHKGTLCISPGKVSAVLCLPPSPQGPGWVQATVTPSARSPGGSDGGGRWE